MKFCFKKTQKKYSFTHFVKSNSFFSSSASYFFFTFDNRNFFLFVELSNSSSIVIAIDEKLLLCKFFSSSLSSSPSSSSSSIISSRSISFFFNELIFADDRCVDVLSSWSIHFQNETELLFDMWLIDNRIVFEKNKLKLCERKTEIMMKLEWYFCNQAFEMNVKNDSFIAWTIRFDEQRAVNEKKSSKKTKKIN